MKKSSKICVFIFYMLVSALIFSNGKLVRLPDYSTLNSAITTILLYLYTIKYPFKGNVVKDFIKGVKNKREKKKYVFYGVMSVVSTLAFLLFESNYVLNVLLYIIYPFIILNFYMNYGSRETRKSFALLSIIFSLLMVFGLSYDIKGNASLVFGSVGKFVISSIKLVGYYYFFKVSLNTIYDYVLKIEVSSFSKSGKIINFFRKNPFWFSVIVLFICYLPYMIIYYPVVINYDAANQIKEVMGIHTRYMDSVILLNENVYITNFNPILHTFLIGGLFKFGYNIGNVNFGMFLYSVIQVMIVICTFAYTISYMKKSGISEKIVLACLFIFALVPVFPMYAMTSVKDVIFSCLVLLIIVKMYDIIKNEQRVRDYVYYFVLTVLMMLFRNNGLYIVVLLYPIMIIVLKKERVGLLVVTICSLFVYFGYNNVLLPYFEIANTSIREALSIPFQQTARHVKYYSDEVSEEDAKVIDNVLGYSTLASRYDRDLSDPVKNEYNKYTTSEELASYFKVWFKYLIKRPFVYIDATINNVYGYFYPNVGKWYIYNTYNVKLEEAGFDYHFNSLDTLRSAFSAFGNAYPRFPVIGLIVNIGLTTWVYCFLCACLIISKNKKYICLLIPGFVLLLTCVAGPANTYFRYILPLTFSLPFITPIVFNLIRKKN